LYNIIDIMEVISAFLQIIDTEKNENIVFSCKKKNPMLIIANAYFLMLLLYYVQNNIIIPEISYLIFFNHTLK